MNQFAKLFDVGDKQVLIMLTKDDDGDIALKLVTNVNGGEAAALISFKHADENVARAKAELALSMMNQQSAENYLADVLPAFEGA